MPTPPSRILTQQHHLQVKTDLNEIGKILEWFGQLQHQGLTTGVLLQAKLALAEGFTNAVRHSHRNRSTETPIGIDADLCEHSLEIRIWDSGPPFDLRELMERVENQYPDPTDREAHWGALIFRKLSHDHGWIIQYHCQVDATDHFNYLQIQIPL